MTAERLRELIDYQPETGRMFQRGSRGRAKAGDEAGAFNGHGRIQLSIDGRKYLRSRLAWLYTHGRFPEHEIDHKNGVRGDDRITNLRDATPAQNIRNRRMSFGTTGVRGVFLDKSRKSNSYVARITVNYKTLFLGSHATLEAAERARCIAEEYYYGDFAFDQRPQA